MALSDAAKEQIKLRSTFLNNLGVASFSVGVLAPIVTSIYVRPIQQDQAELAAAAAFVCFVVAIGLHILAWRHLRRMDR